MASCLNKVADLSLQLYSKKNAISIFSFLILQKFSETLFGNIHLTRTKIFLKTNISYPLISTRTYAYEGVRNVSF